MRVYAVGALRVAAGLIMPGVLLSFVFGRMDALARPHELSLAAVLTAALVVAALATIAVGTRNFLAAGLHGVVWGFVGLFALGWFGIAGDWGEGLVWVYVVWPAAIATAVITAAVRWVLCWRRMRSAASRDDRQVEEAADRGRR